jgi:hypothetical protein
MFRIQPANSRDVLPDRGYIGGAGMNKIFCDPMVICDKDRISWDDNEYLVRLYPGALHIRVEVDLIEDGAECGIFSRTYVPHDTDDGIHEAVWDSIHEIQDILR